jgi:hypothetical protein
MSLESGQIWPQGQNLNIFGRRPIDNNYYTLNIIVLGLISSDEDFLKFLQQVQNSFYYMYILKINNKFGGPNLTPGWYR